MSLGRAGSWMRRLDLGLLAAVAFACVSAWPMLSRSSLPLLTDAHHHIYRTFEILQAWREGILFTRWAPDFYYNYGYPVFNFYTPFTHYLAAAYGWFFGPVAGVKFAMVLSAFAGTIGVYLFGREQWGALPAAVSAAVYASAPYIALTEPITRGAMPEAFAIGMGPIVLWAFTRLARTGSRRFFALSALSLAILIASHNLLSFVLIAFTAAWILWDATVLHTPTSTAGWVEALARPAAAGLLAVGLTAAIWLPAVLERGTVQYWKAFAYPPFNRYTAASALLAPATTADAYMFDASELPYRIGLAQWIFGLLGALTVLRPTPQRRVSIFFALAGLASFGLMVPQAAPIWRLVPVLPYLQFTYRLLGVLVPCLAWLAGALVAWIDLPAPLRFGGQVTPPPPFPLHSVPGISDLKGRGSKPGLRLHGARHGAATVVAGLSLLAAVPLLTPLPWPDFGPVTPKAIYDLEIGGQRGVGTTNDGEFLPITVLNRPRPNPAITAAVNAETIEKVDRAALPAGAVVNLTGHTTLQDDFAMQAPDAFVLRVLTFYWPGWTAYLDGAPVPIQVTNPEGFISVAVPAGSHSLTLRLEDTPPQRLGWIISAGALVLLLALAIVAPLWRTVSADAPTRAETLPAWPAVALLGLAAATILLRVAWDINLTWHAAHDEPQFAGAQVQRFTRFDDGVALVAYDFMATQARPGDKLNLTFYWEVTRPTQQEASVFVHFYGPNGALFGQADKPDPVLDRPTNRWALGIVREDQEIALIRTDAPPGIYTVAVGLWDRSTGRRSRVLDAAGRPTSQDKLLLTDHFTVGP